MIVDEAGFIVAYPPKKQQTLDVSEDIGNPLHRGSSAVVELGAAVSKHTLGPWLITVDAAIAQAEGVP